MTLPENKSTSGRAYALRLIRLQSSTLKRLLGSQYIYRNKIREIVKGQALEIGCGIGRILRWLPAGSIGVDHNEEAVKYAKELGLSAFTTEEFEESSMSRRSFDYLIMAHLLEHLDGNNQIEIFKRYLKNCKTGTIVVVITPQRLGFNSDDTHVNYVGIPEIKSLFERFNIETVKSYSFPLPKFFGTLFKYNENYVIGRIR